MSTFIYLRILSYYNFLLLLKRSPSDDEDPITYNNIITNNIA